MGRMEGAGTLFKADEDVYYNMRDTERAAWREHQRANTDAIRAEAMPADDPEIERFLNEQAPGNAGVPALGGFINTGNAQLIPLDNRIG